MSDFAAAVLHSSMSGKASAAAVNYGDASNSMLSAASAFAHITYGFVGKFLGYCLYMHCRVPVNLSPYLYKCLT